MVAAGTFREDLYYRLNVVTIEMPPLRERKEDIAALANFFIRRFAGELKKKIQGPEPDALKMLMRYHWPGNIRELENAIERAMLLADGTHIAVDDLRLGDTTTTGSAREGAVDRQDPADRRGARRSRAADADRSAEDVELGAEGRRGAAVDQPARDELQDQDARHQDPPRGRAAPPPLHAAAAAQGARRLQPTGSVAAVRCRLLPRRVLTGDARTDHTPWPRLSICAITIGA